MYENLDSSWFEKFHAGDKSSFEWLFKKYHPLLVVYAFKFIEIQADSEDVATEAFVKLFEQRERIKNVQHLIRFLYVSTKNSCLNYLKSKKRRKVSNMEIDERIQDDKLPVYEHMIRGEVIKAVHEAIENLPDDCRRIFKMLFYEELKPAEIAAILQISVNNVYVQKSRAINILRIKLAGNLLLVALLLRQMHWL